MNVKTIWRRITTTRTARALEEEILPHMRVQEAELARQREEVARRGAEIDRQCAMIDRQRTDIGRLRDENRALLNSILGIAGVPPIVVADPPPDVEVIGLPIPGVAERPPLFEAAPHRAPAVSAAGAPASIKKAVPVAGVTPHAKHSALVAPMRRRSWQQIHRALEFAAVQKKQVHEDSVT